MSKNTNTIEFNQSWKDRTTRIKKSITLKIAVLAWGLLITSIITIGVFNYYAQKNMILERMRIEASNVGESIIQANAPSLFSEKYDATLDFSMKLMKSSSSIELIVITKRDGNSLIFRREGFSFAQLEESWRQPNEFLTGSIEHSAVLEKESYRLSKPFIYTGVNWGYIHVGISLKNYQEELYYQIKRTVIFSLLFLVFSFYVTILFSRRLTKPIKEIVKTIKLVEDGNLKARINSNSEDELGILARSFNKMTIAVDKSNELLERKVEERTQALEQTNKQLIGEINEREKAQNELHQYTTKLEILEDIYKGIINAETSGELFYNTIEIIHKKIIQFTMAGMVFYNKEKSSIIFDTYSYINGNFERAENKYDIENYAKLVRHKIGDMYIQNDLDHLYDKTILETMIHQQGRKSYISFPLNYQYDVIGELLFGFDEKLFIEDDKIKILIEISDHVSVAVMQLYLEDKLKIHADELKHSLDEKEILLKEIHHRVKNNLQVISSLLFLQSQNIKDESILTIFKDSQLRVRSLALVHERLYQSDNLSMIDLADYVKKLVSHIKSSYKVSSESIEMILDLDKIYLSIEKAAPVGLILNELLSNSFKYAFPENHIKQVHTNKIFVKLTMENEMIKVIVGDNGVGLPEKYDIEKGTSLGLKIVTTLVRQINGTLKMNPKDYTEFVIEFSKS